MKDAKGHGSDPKGVTRMSAADVKQLVGRNFYHGTARSNLAFSASPRNVAYLTSQVRLANDYAKMDSEVDAGRATTIGARLSVKNPAVLENREMQDLHSMPERVAELKAAGFDSAVGRGAPNGEIAVFDPIHIRSVVAHQKGVGSVGWKRL